MNINWGRFLVALVAAYAVYAILYIGSMQFLFADTANYMALHGRAPEDPLILWGHMGHVLETIAVVFLYFRFVRSNVVADGAIYGAAMGLYLTGMQLSSMGGFKDWSPDITFPYIPVHIIVGMIVGVVLSKLYKAPARVSASVED